MSHHTEGDRIAMTLDEPDYDHPEEEFNWMEDSDCGGDCSGYTKADEARDREFSIREQALGAAMQLNARQETPYADMVIADAQKFAAFLRGTLVTSTGE